jgi:hypothetical protein
MTDTSNLCLKIFNDEKLIVKGKSNATLDAYAKLGDFLKDSSIENFEEIGGLIGLILGKNKEFDKALGGLVELNYQLFQEANDRDVGSSCGEIKNWVWNGFGEENLWVVGKKMEAGFEEVLVGGEECRKFLSQNLMFEENLRRRFDDFENWKQESRQCLPESQQSATGFSTPTKPLPEKNIYVEPTTSEFVDYKRFIHEVKCFETPAGQMSKLFTFNVTNHPSKQILSGVLLPTDVSDFVIVGLSDCSLRVLCLNQNFFQPKRGVALDSKKTPRKGQKTNVHAINAKIFNKNRRPGWEKVATPSEKRFMVDPKGKEFLPVKEIFTCQGGYLNAIMEDPQNLAKSKFHDHFVTAVTSFEIFDRKIVMSGDNSGCLIGSFFNLKICDDKGTDSGFGGVNLEIFWKLEGAHSGRITKIQKYENRNMKFGGHVILTCALDCK